MRRAHQYDHSRNDKESKMMMQMALRSEGTATPLRRVADLKAHIKVIVEVSRAMNMTVTDAMLTAKQAGERSRGFTASREMRGLSRQLDHSMGKLLTHVSRLVLEISALSKDDRALRYLASTREISRANRVLLGFAVRRKGEETRRARDIVQEDWVALGHELHHAFRLLQLSLALARSAKIESVYGGDMAASLKQVVGEINATTQRVMAGVKQFSAYADE